MTRKALLFLWHCVIYQVSSYICLHQYLYTPCFKGIHMVISGLFLFVYSILMGGLSAKINRKVTKISHCSSYSSIFDRDEVLKVIT